MSVLKKLISFLLILVLAGAVQPLHANSRLKSGAKATAYFWCSFYMFSATAVGAGLTWLAHYFEQEPKDIGVAMAGTMLCLMGTLKCAHKTYHHLSNMIEPLPVLQSPLTQTG